MGKANPEPSRCSDPGRIPLDPNDYGIFFSRFAPRVQAYMIRRGLSASTAEELAQEVMLTVWNTARRYDATRAPLSTWVFTIARNRFIDEVRRNRRPKPDPDDPCWTATLSLPAGPEAHALQRNLEARVRAAFSLLSAEQRAALHALYFEGQTATEAATALGVTAGTLKSRARRALDSLRKHLAQGEAP